MLTKKQEAELEKLTSKCLDENGEPLDSAKPGQLTRIIKLQEMAKVPEDETPDKKVEEKPEPFEPVVPDGMEYLGHNDRGTFFKETKTGKCYADMGKGVDFMGHNFGKKLLDSLVK